jgi:uncharacterized protein
MPCVVADTSPLFYLARLEKLSLLPDLYGSVAVPQSVWDETLAGGRRYPGILPFLRVAAEQRSIAVHPVPTVSDAPEVPTLDRGERDAIALARALGADCLLIDDLRGREVAQTLGLPVKGTLAILAEAKSAGLIPSLAAVYRALRLETTFRFSRELEMEFLADAGEHPLSDDQV